MNLELKNKVVHIASNDEKLITHLESAFKQEGAQRINPALPTGPLDILICYVGDTPNDASRKTLDAMMDKLVVSTFAQASSNLEALKKSHGVIVLICAATEPAVRGSLEALTREWAVELAPDGVRTNLIIAQAPQEQNEDSITKLVNTVLFIASPRSSHTTGQIIQASGM